MQHFAKILGFDVENFTSPSTSVEEEIEDHDSPTKGGVEHSRQQELARIPDERTAKDCIASWSQAAREIEAFTKVNANGSGRKFGKGRSLKPEDRTTGRSEGKLKAQNTETSGLCLLKANSSSRQGVSLEIDEMPENFESIDRASEDDSLSDSIEDFDEEMKDFSAVSNSASGVIQHGRMEQSIIAPLDGLQRNKNVPKGNSKPPCRRKRQNLMPAHKNYRFKLEEEATKDEIHESIDSGSSSDDELNHKNLVPPNTLEKNQFVADRFQEGLQALGLRNKGFDFSLPKAKGNSSSGLYGRLQQIIRREKERESNFEKKLQSAGNLDKSSYIDVEILSRCLDAKLIVCKCLVIKSLEDSASLDIHGAPVNDIRERTIIFSPKICASVDLDVGNLIRIHFPWKKVQVKDTDETLVLCSYFSDLGSRDT